jgi:hypothetical protein
MLAPSELTRVVRAVFTDRLKLLAYRILDHTWSLPLFAETRA